MKKLLLASTALVLSAGLASAQGVSLSGDGRMGLVYDGDDVRFDSRARVTFTLSGESDTGLAFGGSFRADNAGAAARGTAGNIFISGDFGKLSMGDVDGAALKAVGDLHFNSLTGLGDRNEMFYLSRSVSDDTNIANVALASLLATNFNNLPRALYEYEIDGFSVFASVDNPRPNRDANGDRTTSLRNFAVGASYTFEGFTGGIGYEDLRIKDRPNDTTETAKHLIASVSYQMDGFEVKAIAGRAGGDVGSALKDARGAQRSQYGASVRGTFDDVTVSAFANRTFLTTNYGVGAAYDLGGGAAITGGIVREGRVRVDGTTFRDSNTVADFGLTFRF